VYVVAWEEGAIIHPVLNVFRVGRSGGLVAQVPNLLGPLEADGTSSWVMNAYPYGTTSVAIERLDARDDAATTRRADPWRYTPDDLASLPGYGDAAIEHGFLYVWAHDGEGHDPLYRYRVAPPEGQRPLLVSRDGAWVGGPYEGRIVMQRADGLWLLDLVGDRVRTTKVAAFAPPIDTQAVAFDGGLVYAALSDGRVVAVDLRDGSRRFSASTSCRRWRGIGVHGDDFLAVCAQRVFAFAKAH
jgi:hypothetical protein